eukprot:938696-Rhodomonas_salina.3
MYDKVRPASITRSALLMEGPQGAWKPVTHDVHQPPLKQQLYSSRQASTNCARHLGKISLDCRHSAVDLTSHPSLSLHELVCEEESACVPVSWPVRSNQHMSMKEPAHVTSSVGLSACNWKIFDIYGDRVVVLASEIDRQKMIDEFDCHIDLS